ncbi:hypothetical protein [Bacteriovorax sp. DB6_IX]|uniref:hypothetical protein n=1 Tax=Bacteriovorax sp. DB6_IX TaxID=1353530 RepID=UPI00040255E8|nr:hypothetical protein [Bacteriovorax sp. DB6_IX]
MLSLFYSKKKLTAEILNHYKENNSPLWLAINFNPSPKFGEISQALSYTQQDTTLGLNKIYRSEETELTLSMNHIAKKDTLRAEEALSFNRDFEDLKSQLIKKQIDASIEKLKELTPEKVPLEEKAWEWFRVSMDVLINALKKIDHVETILQYQLFWGIKDDVMTIRLIAYNLDIQFNILEEGLLLTVFNFKDSSERSIKDREPDQRVLIKGVYNDFFNKFIEVLKTIKDVERTIIN